MNENLDQKRARFAWEKVQQVKMGEYTKLAKSTPALIMQSGLMPVLAFLNDKGKDKTHHHHKELLDHLCEWLHKNEQFKERIRGSSFAAVMTALLGDESRDAAEHARFYQQATGETLALLRWIRQFAAATNSEGEGDDD
ncbi:CRISPR-associated protein [mine drainage metagenome]|uniref:CRISPR type III-B/RAMP module-associated protein Cmr5 n=1 Tax=mine drainage metagenome TaxID=410659 RepID=T1C7R0_9ZZZZ